MQSIVKNELKFVLKDLLGEFIYLPVWWYTAGLKITFLRCTGSIKDLSDRMGLMVWIKNILVPLFGQYDWQGRIISFFMRVFQIIFRSIFVGIWSVMALAFFLVWLILPVLIVSQILYHSTMVIFK